MSYEAEIADAHNNHGQDDPNESNIVAFVCCDDVHFLHDYSGHMLMNHGGRSETVLHVSKPVLMAYLSGAPLKFVFTAMTSRLVRHSLKLDD